MQPIVAGMNQRRAPLSSGQARALKSISGEPNICATLYFAVRFAMVTVLKSILLADFRRGRQYWTKVQLPLTFGKRHELASA
jgi:hypothetical protein